MIKRVIDVIFSIFAAAVISPVILFVSIMVRLRIGSPIIFRQIRPGLNGEPFEMIKFRTMNNTVNFDGQLLPDSERLTDFGRFLRSASLDELPELWNVIIGDMSLVGPRPLLMDYLTRYTAEQYRRHEVRPGVTGWAQVNGRNNISWESKFELDVWYVDNHSFWLDIRILWLTVLKVIKREGVSAKNDATMPVFRGSSEKDVKNEK